MAKLNFNMTKTKVYAMLIFAVIIACLIMGLTKMMKTKETMSEHFTENGLADYNARMTTINVFDAYLKRNPSIDEINKYSAFKNEQDILAAVIKDFPESALNHNLGKDRQYVYITQEEATDDIITKDNLAQVRNVLQEDIMIPVEQDVMNSIKQNLSQQEELFSVNARTDMVQVDRKKLDLMKKKVNELQGILESLI